MKRIVKLSENDLNRIIKRVISEGITQYLGEYTPKEFFDSVSENNDYLKGTFSVKQGYIEFTVSSGSYSAAYDVYDNPPKGKLGPNQGGTQAQPSK